MHILLCLKIRVTDIIVAKSHDFGGRLHTTYIIQKTFILNVPYIIIYEFLFENSGGILILNKCKVGKL